MAADAIAVLTWRSDRAEKELDRLNAALKTHDKWERGVETDIVTLKDSVRELRDDLATNTAAINGLRKTFVVLATSIAGSAVTFAFTILSAVGKI